MMSNFGMAFFICIAGTVFLTAFSCVVAEDDRWGRTSSLLMFLAGGFFGWGIFIAFKAIGI